MGTDVIVGTKGTASIACCELLWTTVFLIVVSMHGMARACSTKLRPEFFGRSSLTSSSTVANQFVAIPLQFRHMDALSSHVAKCAVPRIVYLTPGCTAGALCFQPRF